MYKDFVKQSSLYNKQLLGITASSKNNASGNKSVIFYSEDHYYDSNEWCALSNNDKYKVLNARSNRNRGNNYTKSGGKSNSGGGRKNLHGKWKSKIAMIEKKFRNQKRQLSVFNNAAKPGSEDERSDGLDKEDGNRKHSALNCQEKSKLSKKA